MAPRPLLLVSCFAIAACAWLAAAPSSLAQPQRPTPESQALLADTTSWTIDSLAQVDSVARAAAIHADTMGAGRNYVAEVRAGFTTENRSYWTTRVVLELAGLVYGIVVGLFLLFSRASARMRDAAHAIGRNRYLRALIYFGLYSVVGFVLYFPLAVYSGYVLERQYDLSNQGFGGWFGDELKGLVLGIGFLGGTGLLALAYRAIERYPRRWWMWLAFGSIPVVVVTTLIQPVLIEPVFNKFEPLRDQELRGRIVALAAKAGIPGRKVLEADKSKQTKKYNAYVSGFGASQRIVLWDTILAGMEQDEILFVMGHEMGHYRLGHIWKGIAFFSVLAFGMFYLVGVFMAWATRRFGERWGFRDLHDLASLPLFAIALSLVGLLVSPMVNAYTRYTEHEADTFGLEVTRLNDAGARAFMKLGAQNKSNPEPPLILKWFQYSHPPLVDRVRYAMQYRPWEEGRPDQKFVPVGGETP